MRLRRPAIAATTLGLAGALLPASSAAAAEPADRHVVFSEDVTYVTPGGTQRTCNVIARLNWTFGEEGPQDNTLSASTEVDNNCSGEPSFLHAAVTLRWTNHGYRRTQTYTYSSEGDVIAAVSGQATPYNTYNDGFGADGVSSEHHFEFVDCSSNCEWSHTLTFNSK
jgi:hypothetical protein